MAFLMSKPSSDHGKAGHHLYLPLNPLRTAWRQGFFRPEFLNRLDEIIVFKSLNKQEVREIAELEFRKTFKRCQAVGVRRLRSMVSLAMISIAMISMLFK